MRRAAVAVLLPVVVRAAPQSALHPAGVDAELMADLFWWMSGGAAVIWLLVLGIATYAVRHRPASHTSKIARWWIIGGGVAFPIVVLGGLLIYSLPLTSKPRAVTDIGTRIEVAGEQWWWRVHYRLPQGETVETANEIRLPAGEWVEFMLTSPDVIHSFWIPTLGGKVDMIPGRTTRLVLQPIEPGVYRGACAEYCGTAHALMNFMVVVMQPDEFDRWLERQAAPAQPPDGHAAIQGQQAFLKNGCGACHSIRGTPADGGVGPDLTHVGGRLSLGAAIMPNTREAFMRWIGHTQAVKPDVKMPAFGMLAEEELAAIATYLSGLQ